MPEITRPSEIIVQEDELGPAMRELTIPQRDFVLAYADQGGINAAEAARKAGYGGSENSWSVAGSMLLKQPRILAALREEADSRLKSGAILAASVLVEIAGDQYHRDRYKAAVELLNRAGLVVEGVSRVIVEDHRTAEEIERRIRDLAERLGIDADRLIGTSQIEDVEYEEVGLQEEVDKIHTGGQEWIDGHQQFDAMMERSE